MSAVSITEAARLTGKNRKTIQRYVADGTLSLSQDVAAGKTVEIVELIRVFGPLSHPVPATGEGTKGQHVAPNGTPDVAVLETQIAALKAEISARDALLEAKDKHIASLDTALRLLEGPAPAQRRRWWQLGK